MTYSEAVDYLYSATPMFQKIGAAAYKPGLDTVLKLSEANGHSHRKFPTIHIAGTNGKGSTAHTLAAVLQSAGYRTGLFTSPHLIDFRERIRINGQMVSTDYVALWVENYIKADHGLQPSFFELTTVMAFDLFALNEVDVAVIETGLGGRLDSTNIITPVLSVITNISKDHVAQLGDSLTSIATEKAGIIKPGVDVVLGEGERADVREVFVRTAADKNSELIVASDNPLEWKASDSGNLYPHTPFGPITGELSGECQARNANTIVHALQALRKRDFMFTDKDVAQGFANVTGLTGLMGRWTVISDTPLTVTDTGHNEGGWRYLAPRLLQSGRKLHMVIGFVNDKDVDAILELMPRNAHYYFTRASVPRAMDPARLQQLARKVGLKGEVYENVGVAVEQARRRAEKENDNSLIFIGGSTFIVADALAMGR